MTFCNLIGRRQYHKIIDAVPQLADKLCVKCLTCNARAYIKIFVNVLIVANVNLSDELLFVIFIEVKTELGR